MNTNLPLSGIQIQKTCENMYFQKFCKDFELIPGHIKLNEFSDNFKIYLGDLSVN